MQYAKTIWQDEFPCLEFEFEGRAARLALPGVRADGRWLLKTEYWNAFPALEVEMLRRGWHVAWLENQTRWGGIDADQDAKKRFASFLREEFSLAETCVPVGMSCGGMHAIMLAARHPGLIDCLYLDAPVVNLLSCPMGFGVGTTIEPSAVDELLQGMQITRSQLLSYRAHPLDKLPLLIQNRIPAVLVYGGADDVVPAAENAELVKAAYQNSGVDFECYCKPGCNHHPHGLDDPAPVIAFILKHSKGGDCIAR